MILVRLFIMLVVAGYAGVVLADDATDNAVSQLQKEWAIDNYELKGDAQEKAFVALMDKADSLVAEHPNTASLYIWRGIIKSSYAGVKGGLGALKLAKAAKKDLELAISLDEVALDGSAYTSLGTLYFNVPGWPIGFGSDDKAEDFLNKSLQINPGGIDANYFYGDFLRKEKRYKESVYYLKKALDAPPRPGRELADSGRRSEINRVLSEVEKRLN